MNDRKVKGKPHIEAKQWAEIQKKGYEKLSNRIDIAINWCSAPQGAEFWACEWTRLTRKGL